MQFMCITPAHFQLFKPSLVLLFDSYLTKAPSLSGSVLFNLFRNSTAPSFLVINYLIKHTQLQHNVSINLSCGIMEISQLDFTLEYVSLCHAFFFV